MLFDLRGRGRRTTVRIVYIGLAVLIGVGLVGFGVGGGFGGGGILNSASNNEGSSGVSASGEIKKYEKLTKQRPNTPYYWEQLSKALLRESANQAAGAATETGAPTAKGKELYRRASQAWLAYLALNPKKPSPELAQRIFAIYDEQGLNEPAKAVQALNIVVTTRPIASYYAQLAEFAYKAHNNGLGDLAAAKAVRLAPASERKRLETELAEVKKYPNGGQIYTTTTNGQVYKIRKAPNGSYTAVGSPTPAPGTTTGTTGTTTGTTTGK